MLKISRVETMEMCMCMRRTQTVCSACRVFV